MEKSKTLKALEHALHRLNALPHKYEDTDFKLIQSSLAELYVKEGIERKDIMPHMRWQVDDLRGE